MVKKPASKETILEPDQLQTFSQRIFEYVALHRRAFYTGAGIALSIIIVILAVYFYLLNYEQKAEELYSQAFNSYALTTNPETERAAFESAIGTYEKLLEEYPRSDAADLAYYNLGNIHYRFGEIDKSIAAYEEFTKRYHKDSVLTSLAYYGLGYCYEKKQEYANALRSFEASDKNLSGTHFRAINYSNIARIYEKMNNTEKALEYYRQVLEATDDPLLTVLVKSKIADLDSKG